MKPRRLVLIGFMASGKTEVGRRLARRLGWRHIDLDREIEREQGVSVGEIFAARGEAAFRALEVEITPRFSDLQGIVISPGGGWITNPGLIASLPPDTVTVWLKVSSREVQRRLAEAVDQPVRPLLETDDGRERIEALLANREPLYRQADITVDTDNLSVDEVVDVLEKIVRTGDSPSGEPRGGELD